MYSPFYTNICQWESCVQSGCCICSQSIKNHNALTIQCCLQLFQCNKEEFLRKYVKMGETWIHHFTPKSNQQSAERTVADESRPKWPKTQTSTGKVLASVYWDGQDILFSDYLEKGRTLINEYYCYSPAVRIEPATSKWLSLRSLEKSL